MMKRYLTSILLRLENFRKLSEVFYLKLIETILKCHDLLVKRGCKMVFNRAFKGSQGLFEIFYPKAVGIAFKGDDLLITRVCKRAFNTVYETVIVTDFLSKDVSELPYCVNAFKRSLNEVVLSIPREKALAREVDFPGSDPMELKEALKYQLDGFIPFTANDVYYDVYKVDNEKSGQILIIAVRKNDLDEIMAKLKTAGIAPTRVIISPISLIPIMREKKGKVVTIHKLTNNYCYNTFSDGSFISTLLIRDKDEIFNKIGYDMPDEILEDNKLITPEDNNIAVVNYIDSSNTQEDRDNEISAKKTILISEIDNGQESYGAALYGIQDEGQRFNLLNTGKRVIHLQKILMYGFLGILFLFMFLIPHIKIKRKLVALDLVNNKIALLKDDISQIEAIRNRLTVMEETLRNVGKVQAEYAPRINVLLELSESLPKNSWIKELYIYRNIFEIGGAARDATDLIPTLENSRLFSNVGLTAPVVNTAEGEESFRLKGEIDIKSINGS